MATQADPKPGATAETERSARLDPGRAKQAAIRAMEPVTLRRLAKPLEIERVWAHDRAAMTAALRVVLGLLRVLPGHSDGGSS